MPATDKLLNGYQRFRKHYYKENKQLFIKLAQEGQSPKIAIISCCDSRVDPMILLDCKPGDLFIIRNVANLVPPCESNDSLHGTSAALEFAVNDLKVESIIVLGHAQCGGIRSLIDDPESLHAQTFISKWMNQLTHVREKIFSNNLLTTNKQRYNACERYAIKQSLKNLMSFPWINTRVTDGTLAIHGWYYDLNNAELFVYKEGTDLFSAIA